MSNHQVEFVNFDGQLTGPVALLVKGHAEHLGKSPQELIREIIADALSDHYEMDASGSVSVESITALADAVGVNIPRPSQSGDRLIPRP